MPVVGSRSLSEAAQSCRGAPERPRGQKTGPQCQGRGAALGSSPGPEGQTCGCAHGHSGLHLRVWVQLLSWACEYHRREPS